MRFEELFYRIELYHKQQSWVFSPACYPIHYDMIDILQEYRINFDIVGGWRMVAKRFRNAQELDDAVREVERKGIFLYNSSIVYKDSCGLNIIVVANFE
jgi:hypothetical protein